MFVCRGSDCRDARGASKLRAALEDAGLAVREVRCQDICKGPVAGVQVEGKLRWFARIRGKERRLALVELAQGNKLRKVLAEREAKKRRGKLRKG